MPKVQTVIVDQWVRLHRDHPSTESLKGRMTLDNPEYERQEFLGFSTEGIPRTIRLWEAVGAYVRFPRAVIHPYLRSAQVEDRMVEGEHAELCSRIKLRDTQVSFVDELEEALHESYGVVGQAEPGFGKTVCSLELMSRIGRKTIILVHKEFLMTQWKSRVMEFLDIEEHEVGIVQQDVCEYEGRKVVIAMAQSLLARTYPAAFYEQFGLVVVDEVHRFSAPTFQETITMFPARRRLGVTATPERKDGLEGIFFAHIGQIAAVGEARKERPRVHLVKTAVVLSKEIERTLRTRGRPCFTKTVSYLVKHEARNRQITKMLVRAARTGRKIIVLSARRAHVEELRRLFVDSCRKEGLAISTTYYMGGMNEEARKNAEAMQVMFGTYSMAKEGLDIPSLDTLFMATPIGDVTQAVGRILRTHDGKKEPVVVDFVDLQVPAALSVAKNREFEYRENGWLQAG